MTMVVVHLIAGEEQQIGIDPLDILDDVVPRDIAAVLRVDRVAGERRHDDLVLVRWIAADQPLVHRRLAVADTVRDVLGHVPVLDAERGRPTRVDDLGSGNLLPLAVALHFEPHGVRGVVG